MIIIETSYIPWNHPGTRSYFNAILVILVHYLQDGVQCVVGAGLGRDQKSDRIYFRSIL